MPLLIRDVRERELDSVLALNNAVGPGILALDAARMNFFFEHASYFRVAEVDGHLAGFLIAMRETASYSSPNFAWFSERYPEFVYIDRIVVAEPYRRHGLGRIFYADVTSYAELRVPLLTCEVFLEPRDDVAVLFHGTYGFNEVGQQVMPGIERPVSLLAKTLCSYEFVRDTYLRAGSGALPALPWLAERALGAGTGARLARAGGA
ncbi:MAG: GNAT family N-acetyltransferase [Xanthomonadales bacterium]|nr:GNAT family N-acetyltransferase [Xanthomonadales bacterium]